MAKKKRGRPPTPPDRAKTESLEVRLTAAEKGAMREAADLSGLPLSTWVRERLRRAARMELEEAGRAVAFLESAPPGRKR
jgi:hypothetical protein